MASFVSRRCSSVLLLALLVASVLDAASAIVYNYTNFFNPITGCSVAVSGIDNSIFIGLCSQGTILKLSQQYAVQTQYNTALQQTLAPYNSNANGLLEFGQMGISSAGILWFNDFLNNRLLGVDSNTATNTPLSIDLSSYGGGLALGVSIYTPNVWVSVPGASTGTATVIQFDPTGKVVSTISSSSDPTNLPTNYFVIGVEPDPDNVYVYLGGCIVAVPGSIVFVGNGEFEYIPTLGNIGPCDVRKVSIATGQVVQPILNVNADIRNIYENIFFFDSISVRAVASNNNPAGSVYAFDEGWDILYVFNNATGAQIQNYTGLSTSPAFSASGSSYVLSADTLSVYQYTPGAAPNTIYTISNATFTDPAFVAVGPGGSPVYASSFNNGPIAIMNTQGVITGYVGTNVLIAPEAIATDASGNVYATDFDQLGNGYIRKFSQTGTLMLSFTVNITGSSLDFGAGLAIDPNNGNIVLTADNVTAPVRGTGVVLVYSPTGQLLNVFGQSIAFPFGVAVTPSSTIVVVGANEPASINFINPSTGAVTTLLDTNLFNGTQLMAVASAPDGRLFIGAINDGIYTYSSTGQYLGIISAPSEFIYTDGMAYTTSNGGMLYVADASNDRIVTFVVGTTGPSSSGADRTVASQLSTAVLALASIAVALLLVA